MSQPLNLEEIESIAQKHVKHVDSIITEYVKGAIDIIKEQGGDITKFTLAQIDHPMQIKDTESGTTASVRVHYRIVPIEDILPQERTEQ